MKLVWLFIALFCFVNCVDQLKDLSEQIRYEEHIVAIFTLRTDAQVADLLYIVDLFDLDVWFRQGRTFHILMPAQLHRDLGTYDLPSKIMIPDVQKLIDIQYQSIGKGSDNGDFFSEYRSFDEMNTFVKQLASNYSSIATLVELGQTVQNRPIYGLEISGSKSSTQKKRIVYIGCQHAREWVSPMTVAFVANQLITNYGKNENITRIVDNFDWTIIPIVNGDGYIYTQIDRMWRKNRRQNNSRCYGVDNNRNWPFEWNTGGSSNVACSDQYAGPSGGSEPENTAVANYVVKHSETIGFVDFHSYSQLWMTPWGYTGRLPDDYAAQYQCGIDASIAIFNTHGLEFQVGNIYDIIYPASGGSNDYTYGVGKVTYSYGVELRDTGEYGFLLPPDQIVPSGEEITAATIAFADCIVRMKNFF